MYRAAKITGDTLQVPQLLFKKLTQTGADDARFRVALYVLSEGAASVEQAASALRLPKAKVEAALNYWEGAGLLEQDALPQPSIYTPEKRKKMTTREAVRAGQADPTLGFLLQELQRLFGGVIGESDTNIFVTLYMQDGCSADLILLAASEAASAGAKRAKYVEKILATWRQAGITDCAAADRHLKQQAERTARERELARRIGYTAAEPFTYAERRKIAQWFEEFGYGFEMIEAARLSAGDKAADVKYLAGILTKWYAKGYKTARDVQQGGENTNLRTVRREASPAESDPLMNMVDYVPMKKRSKA